MCHGRAIAAFPKPVEGRYFASEVEGEHFGDASSDRKIAILPDIYGVNPFYRGLAHLLTRSGSGSGENEVYLVNTFAGLGELPNMTREEAFERRHKVRDAEFIGRFETWARRQQIDGVVGFCLGGLYVFELARRNLPADLLGLYGFPQGMKNQDPLPAPFDYLPEVTQPFAMVMGADDMVVDPAEVRRLQGLAPNVAAMELTVLEGVGHNFLPELDNSDPEARRPAERALARILQIA